MPESILVFQRAKEVLNLRTKLDHLQGAGDGSRGDPESFGQCDAVRRLTALQEPLPILRANDQVLRFAGVLRLLQRCGHKAATRNPHRMMKRRNQRNHSTQRLGEVHLRLELDSACGDRTEGTYPLPARLVGFFDAFNQPRQVQLHPHRQNAIRLPNIDGGAKLGPDFTAQRFLIAASIAFLLAAAGSGVGVARDALAGREAAREQQTRLTALRAEVAQLRENAAEISALRRSLEGGAAGPACGALLEAVATTVPASITLTSLRLTGRTVVIDGWVAPGTSPTAVEEWRSRLAPASAPWTASVKTAATGAFTLTGGFRS